MKKCDMGSAMCRRRDRCGVLAHSDRHFAGAQERFPNKPIRLIVPFNAGGAADIVARLIGQSISEKLGQPVVVENRPGATGAIGSLAVARARPDGYTILMAVISSHAVAPAMKKEPPFDPVKDFTPIVRIANSVHTLVSRTSLPVSNVRELIAYAKANPGKVTYGSSGLASFPFLGGKLMERAAGIEMIHVPFSGDAPAMTAVVSQNLDILFTPSGRSYVEAKSVTLLGVAALDAGPFDAGLADAARIRIAGLLARELGRIHGACRNAAADRRSAESGRECGVAGAVGSNPA